VELKHGKPNDNFRINVCTLVAGSSRLLGRVHPDLGPVVAVGLGQPGQGVDPLELIDLGKKGAHEEQKNYKAIESCIGDHESLMTDGFAKPRPHPFRHLHLCMYT
jgi:hypothetical protein